MSNQMISIKRSELNKLENKAKVGWKYYYIMKDDYNEISHYFAEARAENKKLIETIKSGGDVDIAFLKKQFMELYEKVGELTDCPVCMETMTKENSEVGSCGHMICKNCKDIICHSDKKECPICKKAYYVR